MDNDLLWIRKLITTRDKYSEDIDLVQVKSEPIKGIIDNLRNAMSFLGEASVRQKASNNTIVFRFDSEIPPVIRMKLKIEINCREHLNVLGSNSILFTVDSGWFKGTCRINTYQLEELAGTKLRALYQRRKGRDLYDIYRILNIETIEPAEILSCYKSYMTFSGYRIPTQKEFILNLDEKMNEAEFINDTKDLLVPGESYVPYSAYDLVKEKLIKSM